MSIDYRTDNIVHKIIKFIIGKLIILGSFKYYLFFFFNIFTWNMEISDAFGPKIKAENIPGTPMEQVDAMVLSDTTDTNSTSNSSYINDLSDQYTLQKQQQQQQQQQPHRCSEQISNKLEKNHLNHKSVNNIANKDRYWSRPSITPSDDGSSKRRASKQDQEVYIFFFFFRYLSICICKLVDNDFIFGKINIIGLGSRIVNVS